MPWGGHPPCWAGPLTTSLRGPWVSGYLLRAMADRARGRRPDNRPRGDDSDPGLASRRESDLGNCHATDKGTLKPAWTASVRKGAGAQRPHCAKGRGPENPGVVAPFCCCGLSRQPPARSGQTVGEVRPSSLPSSSAVVIQFIDNELNFPAVLRRHGTHRPTFQKTDEFPQMQFLDKLMTSVAVQRLVPGRDSADNCGGSAVPWGPCGGRCPRCAVQWGSAGAVHRGL